ncbi:Bifunctional purine biosynthesis protein PurH [Coemansia brasiliensis]|uniref:Bifunctional purine biosynthesis protein PurH n=1 Tax=Coemansia brasiliensis TaxID=2650707 RepID=A0A9W8M1F2_9FUNG|nr:Bifunctional purine biosynthesis protein PurH [Coemansia brasiliensis]
MAVPSYAMGITKYQLFCVLVASIGSFNFGWNFGVINLPGNVITKCIAGPEHSILGLPSCLPASETIWTLSVGMFPLGALVGAIVCTRFANVYGRKAVLIYSNVIAIVAAVLFGVAINIPMFIIARFLSGVSQGCANGTFSTYVAETTTPKARDMLGSTIQMSISAGTMVAQLASLGLTNPPLWRVLFSITGLISLIHMLLMTRCVESPKWLLSKDRVDEAQDALQKLRKSADCTEEYKALVETVQAEMGPDAYSATIPDLLLGKTPDNLRHQLLLAILCMVFQQFSGISGVAFYSTKLFESITSPPAHYSPKPNLAQILTGILSIVGLLAAVAGMLLAGYFGRRTLMLFSHVSMIVCSALISVGSIKGYNIMAISMVFVFYTVYLVGPGPLPWAIPGEMTPIYAISSLLAIAGFTGYSGVFVIGMAFSPLLDALQGYTFILFAATNTVAAITLFFLLPETKGRYIPDMIRTHSVGIHNIMQARYQTSEFKIEEKEDF